MCIGKIDKVTFGGAKIDKNLTFNSTAVDALIYSLQQN